MKIRTLRLIDLWVGQPICWLMTLAYRLKRIFVKKEACEDPRKILFIKLIGVGSIVLALPAIRAVRRRYPEARLFFLTFKGNEAILAQTGVIPQENVHLVRADGIAGLAVDVFRCLLTLVRERIDVVIDLEFFSRFTAILSFALRSRYRIGFHGFHTEGLKRGSFINYPINYNHTLHTSRALFTLLRPLGITSDDFDPVLPEIPPSSGYRQKISALLSTANGHADLGDVRRWIVINPNTSDLIPLRRWPEGHFLRLMRLLLEEEEGCGIILIGGKGERPYVQVLLKDLGPDEKISKVYNLAGLTTIGDLLDLFHFADLFITNDSGPAHLAAFADLPIITLFGPETPELYAPLSKNAISIYLGLDCQPCVTIYNGKHSYCRDNLCLQQIAPEYVFGIARRCLNLPIEARQYPRRRNTGELLFDALGLTKKKEI